MEYNFGFEAKWRTFWEENGIYKVSNDLNKPKYYVLDMFPYPSGAGLHVGHPLGYVASDIFARFKRMNNFNVLHPMGFDAFGLPAEQYAIETGTHPQITTESAIKTYKEQLSKIGFSFDWSREVKTCDPSYYKWTQWIFLQMFNSIYCYRNQRAYPISVLIKHFEEHGNHDNTAYTNVDVSPFSADDWKGFSESEQQAILMNYRLAFQSYTEVNWCEALGCVLANDEIKDGKSERGGHDVERRRMKQWSLRITAYADRLLQGLDTLDWSESMKDMQRNWIGRSEGAMIDFKLQAGNEKICIFTTRPDTIFGVTFLVLSPEHDLLQDIVSADQKKEIEDYIVYVKSRSDIERQQEKKVTGAFTGAFTLHPFTGKQIPIYIAEYVLAGYGTGAIMAVPADDERDQRFAEKFGIEVISIVDKSMYPSAGLEDKVGKMVNSDFLNGMEVKDAISFVIDKIEKEGFGKRKVNYKLRDASFSRQRYWGEPIPMQYKVVGEPDSPKNMEDDDIPYPYMGDLPLELPAVDSFKPSGDGRSPLANNAEWIAKNLETDTMPGYAGSSWYFLRYTDPNNSEAFASKENLQYWQNVDLYVGGSEHAVGHLLYSRFYTKVLHDLGYVPFEEPFKKMVNQGMIGGLSAFAYKVINEQVLVSSKLVIDNKYQGKSLTTVKVNTANIDIKDKLDVEAFKMWRSDYSTFDFISDETGFFGFREVEKMSKSKYNVVNPDDVIAKYGADCFRMFEMFLGPIELSKPWDDKGITGVSSFLRKFWRLYFDEKTGWKVTEDTASDEAKKVLHKTIKKITDDIERMSFNTCVSQFMIATNELQELKCASKEVLEPLVRCIAPFAPFISEELWRAFGYEQSVHLAEFPKAEEKYLVESEFEYPVSINGKTRASILLPLDYTQDRALEEVSKMDIVQKWLEGKPIKKFVFVKGRIINIVV
jgi:leucyl-tRNA synthetase